MLSINFIETIIAQASRSTAYPTLSGTYTITSETYYDDYSWISGGAPSSSLVSTYINSTNFNTSYNTAPDYSQPIVVSNQTVAASDKDRGKKHQVFERSFDCKLITTEHFFLQKLNYIHNNPCSGVWNLVKNPVDYEHSSERYYIGEKSVYTIADG